MAARKPSSRMIENSAPQNIAKDIYGAIKDIVSPWLGTPPAQNKQVTQAQGLARAAAETLDQTVTGGMIKAGVEGDRALVKQAAINAAALGAGYIAGKAVQTAANAVVKSGVPARAFNAITGRTILVHGSPIPGLTSIKPNLSNAAKMQGYTTPEVYAANPARGKSWVMASDYAQLSGSGVQGKGKGSVYIASVKTKNLINSPNPANLDIVPVFVSKKPLNVIKEYPVLQGSKNFYEDLKRYGAKLPKKK